MARRMTPQRVLHRFVQDHGASSRRGWRGDAAEMLAMQLILQSCEVHRGVRAAVDMQEAQAETDRLMQPKRTRQ